MTTIGHISEGLLSKEQFLRLVLMTIEIPMNRLLACVKEEGVQVVGVWGS